MCIRDRSLLELVRVQLLGLGLRRRGLPVVTGAVDRLLPPGVIRDAAPVRVRHRIALTPRLADLGIHRLRDLRIGADAVR